MCRFQRRAQGKNGDGIIFSGCWLPTVFFAFGIVIPVVNDFSVIVQNTPLCAGFQFNDVEAVASFIGIIKVITGCDGFVVVNFDERRETHSAVFIVDAAAVLFVFIITIVDIKSDIAFVGDAVKLVGFP